MLSTVQVSEEAENNNSGSDNRSDDENSHTSRHRSNTVQPRGFRELRSRIDKFSGASGEEDFEVWLEDFVEATNDCGWSDTQRARWFSWFISGPAKSTWQRTLKPTDKSSWETIVSVYKGQYGVHMDPRTAYQRCHELQYRHFMSVQSLMNAMRDYQRMEPRKLTDDTLESILWNKVPVELQQEVKEITDGSVQELLQKLLRAESVLAERKRRSRSSDVSGKALPHKQETKDSDVNTAVDKENTRRTQNSTPTQGTAEATLRYTKCFNCSQRGHLAKDCTAPKKKSSSRRIIDCQEESNPVSDPWICSVATTDDTLDATDSTKVSRRGPTYKVKVEVEGVRTRALLDHGAQMSIVRRQLLSHIREKWGWTLEQCHAKNLPLESQPVGAGGERLGTIGIVLLKVQVTDTDILREVPCYVLDSSKPLWGGEVSDCGIVIGTNALSSLGFDIIHPDGTTVVPATIVESQSKLNQVDESQADATETQAVVGESQADQIESQGGAVQSRANSSRSQEDTPQLQANTLSSQADQSQRQPPGETSTESRSTRVNLVLSQRCRMGPQQTNSVKVCVCDNVPVTTVKAGVIIPKEGVLAKRQCDVLEGLWTGNTEFYVPITNWGTSPVVLEKGDIIAHIEEVELVAVKDELWSMPVLQQSMEAPVIVSNNYSVS